MSDDNLLHSASHEQHRTPPTLRLLRLLRLEKRDLTALCLYVAITGLLSLAVPLAAQALVNTIAAGVFVQPLVVLTALVFGCLLFAGAMRLLKLTLLERLQKRVFARTALTIAAHLPQVQNSALLGTYAPQLANRFFDVLTVQKTITKILLDAPTAVLQIVIGLLLMAFYSSYLLAFDIFIILFLIAGTWIFGWGGLRTSIKESYQKYHVAEWLEEIARCQTGFKTFGMLSFAVERADQLVMNYIQARRQHFRVIFRQAAAHYLFRAVASAGVLAIGGWLVINREITLGQLVAANLIVVMVLAAIEKIFGLLESIYDLLTALDKVGYVTDLPVDRLSGRKTLLRGEAGASVTTRGLRFAYPDAAEVLSDLDLTVRAGERVSIVGKSGAGKSTLAIILCGLLEPRHGIVTINRMDVRDISFASLRDAVALVSSTNEIFEGTIEENVVVGRTDISHESLMWALNASELDDFLAKFPNGIKTRILSEGRNLSRGEIQRLLIARAIVGRPSLLILDESFTGIDEQDKIRILNELFDAKHAWTIVDISHDPEVVMRSDAIHVLECGKIVETVLPSELDQKEHPTFDRLFPTLSAAVKKDAAPIGTINL